MEAAAFLGSVCTNISNSSITFSRGPSPLACACLPVHRCHRTEAVFRKPRICLRIAVPSSLQDFGENEQGQPPPMLSVKSQSFVEVMIELSQFGKNLSQCVICPEALSKTLQNPPGILFETPVCQADLLSILFCKGRACFPVTGDGRNTRVESTF